METASSPQEATTSTESKAFGVSLNNASSSSTPVPKHTFYLHLKESEFRFNQRQNNLYNVLISFFRKDSL
jgi:hypothetical protein